MPTIFIGRAGMKAPCGSIQRAAAQSPPDLKIATGVGTELKRILSWFGYRVRTGKDGKPVKKCRCDERAAEMNERGIEWCEANQETIIEWLREGAAELEVPFFESGARAAVMAAIWSAKRKAGMTGAAAC